jgi:RNA polymerase sigma-70 factor (ECF subfamily)
MAGSVVFVTGHDVREPSKDARKNLFVAANPLRPAGRLEVKLEHDLFGEPVSSPGQARARLFRIMLSDNEPGRMTIEDLSGQRAAFERLAAELRPRLHRYCARMTGSVIDGEDVVQEALVKAFEVLGTAELASPQAWLFRIAHNTALDVLRRRARRDALHSDEAPDMIADDAGSADAGLAAGASMRTFMRLPVAQRSSIILMDVLGYSLAEVGSITRQTIPAVKAALHRGRTRLRELAHEPDDIALPTLSETERALLAAYVASFNARDFDAVRDMLAQEVRLELVNRTRLEGRGEVSRYFTNYSRHHDWQLVPGFVDRRPALLVRDPSDPSGTPAYFVLLGWSGERVASIRDFRHARYAVEGAEIVALA